MWWERRRSPSGRRAEDRAVDQVIDLTEQSGAEQLAMGQLRSTIGL